MHTEKAFNEKRLLELLAAGSECAFTQIFDYYRAQIFGVAMKFLKSHQLAEEVVHDVFVKVWLNRDKLVNVQNFRAYVFAMTRNQVLDRIKAIAAETSAKKEFSYTIQHEESTECVLIEKQYKELLHKAVDALPPQQKQVFRLAKMEGMSHQVIAEQLHISRLTVKTHMAKALQTIRRNLQHHITMLAACSVILSFPEKLV